MNDETDLRIPWDTLGLDEARWHDAGKKVRATDKQIRLAVCLEADFPKYRAAIAAGYAKKPSPSMTEEELARNEERARKSGSEASMTRGVLHLRAYARELARTESSAKPIAKDISHEELRQSYTEMFRHGDPNLRFKAGEALRDMMGPETGNDWIPGRAMDGLDGARIVRDFMRNPGGAAAAAILHCHCFGVELASMALLHDVHAAMQRETPEVWDILLKRQSVVARATLDERLADEQWQRDVRQKLWLEIGIDIDKPIETTNQQAAVTGLNGGALPHAGSNGDARA